jgi:hypothetical protein
MWDSFPYRYGIIGDGAAEGKCPIDMDGMLAGYVLRRERVESENLKFKAIVNCVFIDFSRARAVPGWYLSARHFQ